MKIPRLSRGGADLTISFTINRNLIPYFQAWYQRRKNDGESRKAFALRMLKESALNDYIGDIGKAQIEIINRKQKNDLVLLQDDANKMVDEI